MKIAVQSLVENFSGSDYIIKELIDRQVEYIFLVPGKQIDSLFNSLTHSCIQPILANHELGAGYMADGYARATRRIAVCMSIGGPGASNLLTSAITACQDESPVLFLTGNIPTNLQGLGYFQDASPAGSRDVDLFQQAVPYACSVENVSELGPLLQKAMQTLEARPHGPAHLSIPLDIQAHRYVHAKGLNPMTLTAASTAIFLSPLKEMANIKKLGRLLSSYTKVVMLIGSGALQGDCAQYLQHFVETFCIPVATTCAAKGLLPETHPLSLGVFDYGSNQRATATFHRDDVEALVLFGLNDHEQSLFRVNSEYYFPERILISVSQSYRNDTRIQLNYDLVVSDYTALLTNSELLENPIDQKDQHDRLQWVESLRSIPWDWPLSCEGDNDGSIPLDVLVCELRQQLPNDTIFCADAGLSRLVANQFWVARQPHSFFTAPSNAPMGWAIGAAIGVQLAHPERFVTVLTGDGSMRMHGFELATAARYQLPILFIISNNEAYGSVCARFPEDPLTEQHAHLPPVNWLGFAQSLGVKAERVESTSELRVALDKVVLPAVQAHRIPFLLEVRTPVTYRNVAAKIGGSAIW